MPTIEDVKGEDNAGLEVFDFSYTRKPYEYNHSTIRDISLLYILRCSSLQSQTSYGSHPPCGVLDFGIMT
jgi:hypothetical protein